MPLALVDTNILIYRFDARYARKQAMAAELLRRGLVENTLRIPHQAIIEFVRAATRSPQGGAPILSVEEAHREAEDLLNQFEVLYPDEAVVRMALYGAAHYHLPWWDAHLWAYAERYELQELVSEDFEHGRYYGHVCVVNPFL